MAGEVPNGKKRRLAGVTVEVRNGTVESCATQLQGRPSAWVLGSPAAWFNALIERETDRLELGGERRLARALLDGLHETLFGSRSAIAT
jgi:hypothetical protein